VRLVCSPVAMPVTFTEKCRIASVKCPALIATSSPGSRTASATAKGTPLQSPLSPLGVEHQAGRQVVVEVINPYSRR